MFIPVSPQIISPTVIPLRSSEMPWSKSVFGHYETYSGGYELRETPKGRWKVTHNGITFGIYNRKADARQAVEDTESGYVPPDDGTIE